jgi:plastocyanin domain-containing protein
MIRMLAMWLGFGSAAMAEPALPEGVDVVVEVGYHPDTVVVNELGTPKAGEIPFHCGMNMIHGKVVVRAEESP